MKNIQSKVMMLLSACLLSAPMAFATSNDCNDVPLDGGLTLLAAAGVGYGIKKVKEKRNRKQVENQK